MYHRRGYTGWAAGAAIKRKKEQGGASRCGARARPTGWPWNMKVCPTFVVIRDLIFRACDIFIELVFTSRALLQLAARLAPLPPLVPFPLLISRRRRSARNARKENCCEIRHPTCESALDRISEIANRSRRESQIAARKERILPKNLATLRERIL